MVRVLTGEMLTIVSLLFGLSSAALAKLAQHDSDNLSDEAILKELELSSKEIEVEALSGEWI